MLQDVIDKAQRKAALYYASKTFRMQNRAPCVTFTFDEVPDSAYVNGASILEEHGVRGTFYIAAGTCDTQDPKWHVITAEQVRGLHDRGHEIGCHTFSNVSVHNLDAATVDEECRMNHNLMRRLCGDIQLTNFCYPFGNVSLMRKLQLQKRFDSCRSDEQGINVGSIDLGLLKVIDLYSNSLTPDKLQRVLRTTCDSNGWLIFCMHDIVEQPSVYGCTPELLRNTLETVQSMGLSCVTVRDALRNIGYTG